MNHYRPINPYIAGSPVTGSEMFFGREDVFAFVRQNLIGQHRDTPIVLYGQRRTGKTSVLYQMQRNLDSRYRCIFIDLHGLSLDGVGNLLWGIANFISRGLQREHQLTVEVPTRAAFLAAPESTFETVFLDAVLSALGQGHLVLMLDEVVRLDEEVKAGRLDRGIFDYLRHLMQHFPWLNFIFSLGSGLEEMQKDYALLFSGALYHRISFLEPTAAKALITQPVQDHYQMTEDAQEKILRITSGHPYYIQLVSHCIFNRWLQASKCSMTAADVEAVQAEAIELGSANLTFVWEDSTAEEKAVMAGMAAAMRSDSKPVTLQQIRKSWRKVRMPLPESEAVKAVKALMSREVVVGKTRYSFAVDLQRRWLEKHRRLDWVKEELSEAVREWARRPAKHTRVRWIIAAAIVAVIGLAAGLLLALLPSRTPRAGQSIASPASPAMAQAIVKPSLVYVAIRWKGWVAIPKNTVGIRPGWIGPVHVSTTCSGFVANPSGWIVTAGHCVDNQSMINSGKKQIILRLLKAKKSHLLTKSQATTLLDEITVNGKVEGMEADSPPDRTVTVYRAMAASGAATGEMPAQVVDYKSLKDGDVALLKVRPGTPMPTLEVAPKVPPVGAQIISAGYPGKSSELIDLTAQPSFIKGSASGTRTVSGVPFTEITSATSPGMSGGPVADLHGRVIGTLSFSLGSVSQSANFITDTGNVRTLLNQNGVSNKLSAADQAYRAGLSDYFTRRYHAAVKEFLKVLAFEPDNLEAQYYQHRAIFNYPNEPSGTSNVLSIVLGATSAVVIAAVITLALVRSRRRRRMTTTAAPVVATGPTEEPPSGEPVPAPPASAAPSSRAHPEGITEPPRSVRRLHLVGGRWRRGRTIR